MKRPKIDIEFTSPKHGWLRIMVKYLDQSFLIEASQNFDPFDDFFRWLEDLVAGNLPSKWQIVEEGPFMEFEVSSLELGKARFTMKGTTRELDFHDLEVYTFIDEMVNPVELARSFYTSFREFIDQGFDSYHWNSNLDRLQWRRIQELR